MLEEPHISTLGKDPANRIHRINANSFQQNAITTIHGWQYVAYYTEKADSPAVCLVNLARRRVKGQNGELQLGDWEKFVFEDYEQVLDDGHNTISIGVCRGDGTIHLSFDHHCNQYDPSTSFKGLADQSPG